MVCYAASLSALALWPNCLVGGRMQFSNNQTPETIRRFGGPFQGPIIPSGSMIEHHPISATSQGSTSSVRKFYLEYSSMSGMREKIWKGKTLRAERSDNHNSITKN